MYIQGIKHHDENESWTLLYRSIHFIDVCDWKDRFTFLKSVLKPYSGSHVNIETSFACFNHPPPPYICYWDSFLTCSQCKSPHFVWVFKKKNILKLMRFQQSERKIQNPIFKIDLTNSGCWSLKYQFWAIVLHIMGITYIVSKNIQYRDVIIVWRQTLWTHPLKCVEYIKFLPATTDTVVHFHLYCQGAQMLIWYVNYELAI